MAKAEIHLHWSWRRKDPNIIKDVSLGLCACGLGGIPRGQFTLKLAEVTCAECIAASKRPSDIDTPPPPASKAPALKGNGAKGRANYPASAIIVMAVKHNIRKAGSAKHTRFQVLLNHHGKTYGEFIKAGGNPITLKNAVNEHLCEVQE